ncbi:MAG: T9SS type A sorting domain-containing protein [Candidatus Eisenbacteria sp.]|nr:T9SS type A sorting domain-containing protein [Candidatus Eisenbacteria bacterium]
MKFESLSAKASLPLLAAILTLCLATGMSYGSTTLLLRDGTSAERPVIEVFSSDQDQIHLAFELPTLEVHSYDLDSEVFQTVAIAGGVLQGETGEASLPTFTRFVAIPDQAGVVARVVSTENESFSGFHLLPMQDPEGETFELSEEFYSRDEFLGNDVVSVGEPSIMRDLRIVPITFHPVSYNPVQGKIRVASRVEVTLDLTSRDLRNEKQRDPIPRTAAFDKLYGSLIVNSSSALQGRSVEESRHLGHWLIIARDNSTVTARLQPLIEWRTRMGYKVTHATTAQTGTSTTSIKNWILNLYNSENPPDYITLVGDVGGSFSLPTFYENHSNYHGEGDHGYVELEGSDLVPDAFIGRLSAESYDQLEIIVDKIVGYESDPYITDPNWFSGACLVGDPSYSGITCIQIQQWVKEKLRYLGYAQIDTIWSSPFEYQIRSSINAGKSYFGYRGYWGMSGWDNGDIYSLNNGERLPFALNLTCGTGSFASGTSINEAWLRAGSLTYGPAGGIGSVATATLGTHTRFNNCFYSGMAYGLFWEDHYQLGPAQARGKMEMISNYAAYQYSQAGRYCYWNSLMGDPATEMWTGYPAPLLVYYPNTVSVGANVVTVVVWKDGLEEPVEGAWVYLYREGGGPGEEIAIGGYADETGTVDIPIDASVPGTVQITVTGHNLYPYQSTFEIGEVPVFIGLEDCVIDDDSTPPSQGNGDGQINPGETIGLGITLKNYGSQAAMDVTLTVSCDDPYIGLIDGGPFPYGTILPGYHVATPSPVIFRIYGGCPVDHVVHFDLVAESALLSWHSVVDLPVTGPELVYASHELIGVGTSLDPGDVGTISVTIENPSFYAADGPIEAILISDNYSVQVTDPYATYAVGGIPPEGSASNASDPFGVSSPGNCVPGGRANLRIALRFSDGVRDTVHFTLEVGQADSHDPTGPDDYGYLAFDQTDTTYPEAPTYSWIDINPSAGGPGTSVGLNDYGWNQDDSKTVDLPFPFQFYGETFTRVTICSNGWIAMGSTYLDNYRNWYLPSAGGPEYMIAPFWDNLYQSGTGKVYDWHDELGGRYVVAWDNVRNRYSNSTESFEVILYDPSYYPTRTGDGIILFQYETIHNNDTEQMYSTSGIQDEQHTTGITFNYFNQRPPTAASYSGGLAVKFTTQAPGAAHVPLPGAPEPIRVVLSQNQPNPLSSGTTIRFQLKEPRPVALQVYDVDGHLVRTLLKGQFAGGNHAVGWTGIDNRGRPVPSGVYFYRLEVDDSSLVKKMLVVR